MKLCSIAGDGSYDESLRDGICLKPAALAVYDRQATGLPIIGHACGFEHVKPGYGVIQLPASSESDPLSE